MTVLLIFYTSFCCAQAYAGDTNRNRLAVPVSHFRGRWHPCSAQWLPFWCTSIEFDDFFGNLLAIFPFSIQLPSKIVNSIFPSKMLNSAIPSIFRPKNSCSVLNHWPTLCRGQYGSIFIQIFLVGSIKHFLCKSAYQSFKVINGRNRNSISNFLLVRHRNLGSILHPFRDIAGFLHPTPIPP